MPFTAAIIADLHEKLKNIESQLVYMIPLTELLMSQFPVPQIPSPPHVSRSSDSFKPPPHVNEVASHRTLPKGVINRSSLHGSEMIERWASNEEWEHQMSGSQMSGIHITSNLTGPQGDCANSNSVFSAAESEASGNIWKQLSKFQNKETSSKSALTNSSRSNFRPSNTQRPHRFSTALSRTKMSNESTAAQDPIPPTEPKTADIIKSPPSPMSIKKSQRTGPKADNPLKDSSAAVGKEDGSSVNSNEALCGSLITIEESVKTPVSVPSSRFHQDNPTPTFLRRTASDNIPPPSPCSSVHTSHTTPAGSNAVSYRQELKSETSRGHSKESLSSNMSSRKPEPLSRPLNKFVGSTEFQKLRKARGSIMEIVIKNSTVPMYSQTGSVATFTDDLGPKDVKPDEVQPTPYEIFWATGLSRYSFFSVNWELFMAAIYFAIIWFIPYKLAMDQDIDWSFSIALSLIFAVDNFVTFMTVQPRPKLLRVVKNPTLKDWQKYYLKTNFVIDLIVTVPFELIPYGDCHYLWVMRCLRLYKLPRTVSGSPYFMLMRKKIETILGIGQTFSGFFPLMFTLCAFLHVQACVLFFIGRLCQFSNAVIAQVQYRSDFDKYVWALFTAVGNTFPVFYKPNSPEEQISTLCFTIVGAGLYASIVGTISSLSIGMDASGRLYKQKIDELKEYMGWKDLDDITRRKVLKYYELKYRGKFFEEATLLNEMNDSLRMEIAAHNCKQLISKVGFLHREMGDGRDHVFLGRIATALSAVYFIPGDIIISAGDMGSEMFFILKGTVNIMVNGAKVGQLVDGAFFGELALIANIPRTATVQALTPCSLYRLTRVDLMRILPEFEDMKQRMDIIYQQRMEKVRKEEELRKLK
ncbi:hypothetical protein HDU81_005281 [Chytriomyces hyalinus]|nr:hypothetical protein HDU81_005281 [Chytriomyces hyalinus]